MAAKTLNIPLVVIVGPTASGKTSLAIDLAVQFHGEIISADSRAIYKGMDIGTAKPTVLERKGVPHFGLDIVEPGDHFSAADFKQYADQKIMEIRALGHVPFLVGGTGLYIDSVVFDYQFGSKSDKELRVTLEALSIQELYEYCDKRNIELPENKQNKRYIIRAIETATTTPTRRLTPEEDVIIVGITTDKVLLRTQIKERSEQLFENGVVDEAIKLGNKYGWENEAMTSNVYRVIHEYRKGKLSFDELKLKNEVHDWRLAKRQMTWLKRNNFIQWFSLTDARDYLSTQLAIYK